MAAIAITELDAWPQLVNDALVEPATGVIRVGRPGSRPIELATTAARELADAAGERDRMVLLAAVEEAERQSEQLSALVEGRWTA